MKHRTSTALRALIFIIIFSLVVSTAALAAGGFDADRSCGMTIRFTYEGAVLPDAEFAVYRVGELSAEGSLSLSGAYADYPVVVDGLADAQFRTAAETLYGYVQLDGHKADWTLTTNGEGVATLSDLPCGLYLVAGAPYVNEGSTCVTAPVLLTLPNYNDIADEWVYSVEILPKCRAESDDHSLKVLKVWEDAGNEAARPTEVAVKLLRDGEVAETVKLNKENNWRYIWEQLDGSAVWTVVEEINDNYTVVVEREGVTYVITNTVKNTLPDPSPTPTPVPSKTPIPQTGQVWWPVPVLLMAGVLLIAVGMIGRKEDDDEA